MSCCIEENELAAGELGVDVFADGLGCDDVFGALEDEATGLYAGKIGPVVGQEGGPGKLLSDLRVSPAKAVRELLAKFRPLWIAHNHRCHGLRPAHVVAIEELQQFLDLGLGEAPHVIAIVYVAG